jgi:hypothetical protein
MATGGRTFTSAAQSQYQITLQNEAKAAGIPIDDLRELLAVTNANPDLIAFPTACESILWICDVIKRVWKTSFVLEGSIRKVFQEYLAIPRGEGRPGNCASFPTSLMHL